MVAALGCQKGASRKGAASSMHRTVPKTRHRAGVKAEFHTSMCSGQARAGCVAVESLGFEP